MSLKLERLITNISKSGDQSKKSAVMEIIRMSSRPLLTSHYRYSNDVIITSFKIHDTSDKKDYDSHLNWSQWRAINGNKVG